MKIIDVDLYKRRQASVSVNRMVVKQNVKNIVSFNVFSRFEKIKANN